MIFFSFILVCLANAAPSIIQGSLNRFCISLPGPACWGRSDYGQNLRDDVLSIGDDPSEYAANPVMEATFSTGIIEFSMYEHHTCLLFVNGLVRCGGRGGNGRLGSGSTNDVSTSSASRISAAPFISFSEGTNQPTLRAVALSRGPGSATTCAIFSNGKVRCWGANGNYQVGNGGTADVGAAANDMSTLPFVSLPLAEPVLSVANGAGFTCALFASSRAVTCWGTSTAGALGVGSATTVVQSASSAKPVTYPATASRPASIHAATAALFTLMEDGTLFAAGDKTQVGLSSVSDVATPRMVRFSNPGLAAVKVVTYTNTCVLFADGTAVCFGPNHSTCDPLGAGPSVRSVGGPPNVAGTVPVSAAAYINFDEPVVDLAVSGSATCFVLRATVRCIGAGDYGALMSLGTAEVQLGTYTATKPSDTQKISLAVPFGRVRGAPTRAVVFGQSAVSLETPTSDSRATCVLRVGEGIYCFGAAASGSLGLGPVGASAKPQNTPLKFSTTHPPTGISTGGSDSICAVFGTAGARCWGTSTSGNLGQDSTETFGTSSASNIVSQMPFINFDPALGTAVTVEVSLRTSCALMSSRSIVCWGKFGFSGATVVDSAGSSAISSIRYQRPLIFSDTAPAISLSGGRQAFCAQFVGLRWRCWGTDEAGTLLTTRWVYPSLPAGTASAAFAPYLTFDTTSPATAIAIGVQAQCSLHASGAVKCWGNIADGIGGLQRSLLGATLSTTASGPAAGSEVWYYQLGDQKAGVSTRNMGYSVALSADGLSAVAGAHLHNSGQGGVHTFRATDVGKSGPIWTVVGSAPLSPASGSASGRFGSAVALSADALTLVVCSPAQTGGSAFSIYTRSSPTSDWTATQELVTPLDAATTAVNSGAGVAISRDGSVIAFGAYTDSSNVGAAWVFCKGTSLWTQVGPKLVGTGSESATPYYGWSVALAASGTLLFVGAPNESVGGVASAGAVWVFSRDSATGQWEEHSRVALGTAAFDYCGVSLTASADGSVVAAGCMVGSTGKVVILRGSVLAGGWAVEATLLASAYVSSATATLSSFGFSVALSEQGSTLVIGAPFDDTGAGQPHLGSVIAVMYDNTTASWRLVRRMVPETATAGTSSVHAGLGQSVAVSSDAGRILGGAFMEGASVPSASPGDGAGAIYTFQANSFYAAPSLVFSDTVPAIQVSVGRTHACALFANKRARCWGRNRAYQIAAGASTSSVFGTSSASTLSSIGYINFGVGSVGVGGGAVRVQALAASTCLVTERGLMVKCWGHPGGDTPADAVGLDARFAGAGDVGLPHTLPYVDIGSPRSALIVSSSGAPVLAGGVAITLTGGFSELLGIAPTPIVRFAGPAGCVVSPGSVGPAFLDVKAAYLTWSSVVVTTPPWPCAPESLVSVSTDGGGTFSLTSRLFWVAALSSSFASLPVIAGQSVAFRCALMDGRLLCWGKGVDANSGATGYLGREDTSNVGCGSGCVPMSSMTPIAFSDTTRIVQFDAAHYHACALFESGALRCWGDNYSMFLLGISSTGSVGSTPGSMSSLAPIVFQGTTAQVVEISLSDANPTLFRANHACARFSNGALACWGTNAYGQLGQDSTISTSQALSASTAFISFSDTAPATSVAAGGYGTCAIFVGGRLRCWGRAGGLFGSSSTSSVSMVKYFAWPEPSITVTAIVVSLNHRCAVFSNARMRCWEGSETGSGAAGSYGQVGNPLGSGASAVYPGDLERAGAFDFISFSPANGVDPTAPIKQVALGYAMTVVLFANGRVLAFGRNNLGQMRLPVDSNFYLSTPPTSTPASTQYLAGYLPFTLAVASISAGPHNVCAVFVDGSATCWGCSTSANSINACLYLPGTDLGSTSTDSVLTSNKPVILPRPKPSLSFTPVSAWPTAVSTAGGQTVYLTGGLGLTEGIRTRALVRLSGYSKTWTSDPIVPASSRYLSFLSPAWTTGAPETLNVSVSTDAGQSWSLVPGKLLMVQYTNCSTMGGRVSAVVGESPAGNVVSVGLSIGGKTLTPPVPTTSAASGTWVTHAASFSLPADPTSKPDRLSGSGVTAFPASTLSSPYRNMVFRADPPLRAARWELTAGGGPAPGAAHCWVNMGGDTTGYDDGVRDVFVECSGSPTRVNVEVTGVPVSPLEMPSECRMPPIKAFYSASLRRVTVTWPRLEQDTSANEYEASITPAVGWTAPVGAQHIYKREVTMRGELQAPTSAEYGAATGHRFGHSVSVSALGDVIVAGVPLASSETGAVAAYHRATDGTFSTRIFLPVAGYTPSGVAKLGGAVRISGNGLVIVAVAGDEGTGGMIYIWTRPNAQSTTWTVLQKFAPADVGSSDQLGCYPNSDGVSPHNGHLAISFDGSWIAVGSVKNGANAGAFWVYELGSGGTYALVGSSKVVHASWSGGVYAAPALAITRMNGLLTVFVTCPRCQSGKGTLIMYRKDPATGSMTQYGSTFTHPKATTSWKMGSSISVSEDGSTVALGCAESDADTATKVYGGFVVLAIRVDPATGLPVFVPELEVFKPPTAFGNSVAYTPQWMGKSVALNANGTLLAVGVPFSQMEASVAAFGAMYLFARDRSGGWVSMRSDRYAPFAHSSSSSTLHAQFGFSLAMSGDGSVLAVSAPAANAVTCCGSSTEAAMGSTVNTVNKATGRVLVYSLRPVSPTSAGGAVTLHLPFASSSAPYQDLGPYGFGTAGSQAPTVGAAATSPLWLPSVEDNTPWRPRSRPPTTRRGVIVLSSRPVVPFVLAIATVADLQTTAVTVTAWVRTAAGGGWMSAKPTVGETVSYVPIIEAAGAARTSGFTLTINPSGCFALLVSNCATPAAGATRVTDDRWHHVAVATTLSNSQGWSLYVDGVLDASGTFACSAAASTSSITIGSSSSLIPGSNALSAVPAFEGALSDIRWYKRVLTSTEVLAIYWASGLTVDADLKVLLAARTQTDALTDSSGSGNHAAMTPGTAPLLWLESLSDRYPTTEATSAPRPGWIPRPSGQGTAQKVRRNVVYFNGWSSSINVAAASDLLSGAARAYSFWILISSSDQPPGSASCASTFGLADVHGCLRVVMDHNVLNTKSSPVILHDLRTGQLASLLPGGTAGSDTRSLFACGVKIDDNRWHHVTYVASNANSGDEWHVDGVRTAAAYHSTAYDTTPGNLVIGTGNAPLNANFFQGFLADFKVLSVADLLSRSEQFFMSSPAEDDATSASLNPGQPRVIYRGLTTQFSYDPLLAGVTGFDSPALGTAISIKATPLKPSGCGARALSAPVVVYSAPSPVMWSNSPARWVFAHKFEESSGANVGLLDWSQGYRSITASTYLSSTAVNTVAFPTSLPMALQSLRCADLSTTTDLEFPRHRGLNPVGPARTISVAFWMRTPASWSGVYVSVMSAPASGTARVELKVKTTHIALTFEQMGAGGLAEDFECQVGVNLAASTWYHVALVAAGSRKREVYINGELRCSAVLASYESNAAGSGTLTIKSGSGMLIDEFYATGNLIWNAHVRALFASGTVEALALCGNGVIDAGEACDDGNFDDADGCRIDCTVDSTLKAWIKSGAGDDASPGGVNFATLFDGAVAGPGLRGESDAAIVFSTTLNQNPAPRVEIPAVTTMIGATPIHRWTLAFWVYFQPGITASTILPYMEYAGDGPLGLFFVGCNSNTCDHAEIRPLSITGSLSSANRIYPLGRLDGIGLGPAGANIVKGAWIHVAVVTEYQRDAAFVNRMQNLYINGVRVSSSYGFGCNNCAGPSRTANFGAAAGYQFYGSLSDIRMFHRAFGSGQIKDLFLSSLRVGGVEYPRDCSDIMELAARRQGFEPIAADPSASRFYTVYPFAPADITRSTQVFCDMSSRGGGWTLVMHSKDGYLCGGDLSVPCGDYEPAGQEGGSAHIQYASKIMALSGEALVTWGGSAPSTGVATESDSAMIFSTHLMMEPGPLLASARAGVSCTSLTDPSPTWRPLLWSRCDTGINQVPSSTIFTSEAQWFTGSDFSVCFGTAYGFVRRGATNVCDDTTASAASGFAAIFWSQPNMPSLPACRGIKGASTFVPAYSQLWVRSMVSVDRQTAESETTVAA